MIKNALNNSTFKTTKNNLKSLGDALCPWHPCGLPGSGSIDPVESSSIDPVESSSIPDPDPKHCLFVYFCAEFRFVFFYIKDCRADSQRTGENNCCGRFGFRQ